MFLEKMIFFQSIMLNGMHIFRYFLNPCFQCITTSLSLDQHVFAAQYIIYTILKCISFLNFLIVNFLILALLFFSYKYLNSLCFLLYVFVVVVIVVNVICEALVRGTQREYSSKPLKHSFVKRILVFKR